MALIQIYKGDPTAAGTDGTLVSSGDGTNPIESGSILVPETGFEEGDWVKLAVRCDTGYETEEADSRHAQITIVDSASVTYWQLAPDDNDSAGTPSDWGDPLDFASQVDDTNTIFWARARAADSETPVNDTTVSITVSAVVAASA